MPGILSVASRPKRRARVTETSFEKAFAKALLACGLKSWHMNCREAGWPDRYVVGGIWIEFKVVDALGINNGTEPEQRAKLHELERSGDKAFYCARFEDKVVIAPWHAVAGKSLAHVPRYAYRDGRDLEQIVQQVIMQ